MAKSFYIAGVGLNPGKHDAALATLGFAQKKGPVGFFKPVALGPDDAGVKEAMAQANLPGSPADYYALTRAEAFTLLGENNELAILDAVLNKYSVLSKKYDKIIIEGLDMAPTSGALAYLDATIAANLGKPTIILANSEECGCGCSNCNCSILDAPALAVATYKKHLVDILALAVIAPNPAQVATDQNLAPLKGVEVWGITTGADISSHLEAACSTAASRPRSKVVTPKRFEFDLIEKARLDKQHIVLPEGNDERILRAANDILEKDFVELTILGDPEAMTKKAKELGLTTMLNRAQLINNKTSELLPELTQAYYELRKAKGITEEKAAAQMQDRNFFATMLVKTQKADGMVSGADGTTADTIRPALSIIKTKPGHSIASSVFLMCLADRVLVFGDCAINPNPNAQQLAEIALISAQTAKAFGVEPKVAMLSYSTGSSGGGPDVQLVAEATQIAKESALKLFPGLALDGPLQFDAAIDPKTGASKMPGSPVAGQATVMIFPDLGAGNIAYKAVQRTANAVAIGPIIQGLNRPVNDLSRGTLVADIVNTVAITALQAMADKN